MNRHIAQLHQLNLPKWILLIVLIGTLAGTASALFLMSLDWVTHYRENNFWLIALLPFGGLLIGLIYHYLGQDVAKGNNLLIEEYDNPQKRIHYKMATLVLIGTLITHLFGGSAGREGTAVQMGGAISDQFTHWFKLNAQERRSIILMGISAGFASVFGTPLAGAVFALEIMLFQHHKKYAILPVLLSGYIAHYVCLWLGATHTHYNIDVVPSISFVNVSWAALAGILFGLCAMLFSFTSHFFSNVFSKIKYAPIRPLIGGVVLAIVFWLIPTQKYMGLGVPVIVASFSEPMQQYDFFLKILFTAFTLSSGFKGGEVTPLFYIGATLGNVLIWFIPLPMGLLAGMGFVAVFAGATHAPLACAIMGMELFGLEAGLYLFVACFFSFLFSGKKGIYRSQKTPFLKNYIYDKMFYFKKGKKI